MSDTKALLKYVRDRLNDGPNITFGKPTVCDLANALEQAEALAEKAEKELAGADAEISELRDELEDSRGTEKDAPNVLCAIARLVGVYEHCQELGDDMGTMSLDSVQGLLAEKQKAEAENVRLTKIMGWLAGRCAEHCCDRWGCDCTCRVNGCAHENDMCSKPEQKDWEDAASRAVDDESEVKG